MPTFKSVTQISRAFSLTVPALKRVLAEAGYLAGKHPTEKAATEGMFEMRPIDRADPAAGDFAVWDEGKVVALLRAAGLDGDPGNGIWNCHSAIARLGEAAALARTAKRRRTKDVESAIGWSEFEWHTVLMAHMDEGRRAAGALVRREAAALIAYLDRSKADDDAGRVGKRKMEAVLAWFQAGPA